MSQHQKLVCGGLSVFLAITHVGCAGSGLKNMFSRNETDGYHTLDELEAEQAQQAEESEDETSSVAARLASWRPFGKSESNAEEEYAASEADTTESDTTDAKRKTIFPGFTFPKRDNVEPDPFLGNEAEYAQLPKPSASPKTDLKVASTEETAKKSGKESDANPDSVREQPTNPAPNVKDSKSRDTQAVASGAAKKSDSSKCENSDEDNLLAKRFEQHFLLNSIGTIEKPKAETVAEGAKSNKRDVAKIADRQITSFDELAVTDSGANAKQLETQSNFDSVESNEAKQNNLAAEYSENSLFAFDELIGQESEDTARKATQVAHKFTQNARATTAAMDINVADAEALFGAAAARQKARMSKSTETVFSPQSSVNSFTPDRPTAANSKDSVEFECKDSPVNETTALASDDSTDVSGAFARLAQSNAAKDNPNSRCFGFGAPTASARGIEDDDYSVPESDVARMSSASAAVADRQVFTADYGTGRPKVLIHPASSEASNVDNAYFTIATAAPTPGEGSTNGETNGPVQTARPGLVQSLSTRNWLLLIGGIIVIALLFAPGRTKPLTLNG